jgi:hypothetical protein
MVMMQHFHSSELLSDLMVNTHYSALTGSQWGQWANHWQHVAFSQQTCTATTN